MLFSHIVKIFEFIKAEVVIKALLEPHVKLAIFLVEFDKKLRKLPSQQRKCSKTKLALPTVHPHLLHPNKIAS